MTTAAKVLILKEYEADMQSVNGHLRKIWENAMLIV